MADSNRMKLFTDGGSRGNPGKAACACVLFDNGDNLVTFDAKLLGEATNNEAEYHGILLGLKVTRKHNPKSLECYLDSELVVKQLNNEYKVKDSKMKDLKNLVDKEIKKFSTVSFIHVKRSDNSHADKLLNLILDSAASAAS